MEYIECDVLKAWIDEGRCDFLVVDVREGDYSGVKVRGSVNIPYGELGETAFGRLVEIIKERVRGNKGVVNVVFHCFYSSVRGPSAAEQFFDYTSRWKSDINPKIWVLRGGINKWMRRYRDAGCSESI